MLGIIGLALGVCGFLFGVLCYYELWKWASQCRNVRIAIAYKGKVKWDTPLTEYLFQSNLLEKEKDGYQGRVFYREGGTALVIRKTNYGLILTFRQFLRKMVTRKQSKVTEKQSTKQPTPNPRVKQGYWKGTADDNKG